MITVLQLAQLPNIKVATVLLSSAFAYDIFWVFISPLIFHESVMIANPRVALQPPRMVRISYTFPSFSFFIFGFLTSLVASLRMGFHPNFLSHFALDQSFTLHFNCSIKRLGLWMCQSQDVNMGLKTLTTPL